MSSQVIVTKVKFTIYGNRRGWCFTPNDFYALGSDVTVRKALSRLEKNGFIRRLSWGLYDYPRKHPKLGLLPADTTEVVKAIARKDNIKLLPSGAQAANMLGLSDQVPAKIVYLTQGLSKRIRLGKQEIIFKKTTPKSIASADTRAGIIIQALKYLGKNHVDKEIVNKLKRRLKKEDLISLKKYKGTTPVWLQTIILDILGEK